MAETPEQKIARLEAELEAEQTKNKKSKSIVVSKKGAVQINGMRRYPVVFYADEWEKIFALKEDILEFIEWKISWNIRGF